MNVSESVSDDVLDKIGKEFSDRDGAAMMMCISAVCASLMWKTYAAIRLCEGKIKKEGAADTWVSTVFTYPLAPKDRTVQIVKSELRLF
jgi:hypothetical protein